MLKLAEIFQDNMVLQREKPVTVWGMADSGSEITVEVQGKKAVATADEEGFWRAVLAPLAAAESEILTVSCGDGQIQLKNVAVGEVWVAGGQSNMEFYMRYEKHKKEEMADCENPRIRFFDVPKISYAGQRDDFDYSRMGYWRHATPEDLEYFTAVGYYFEKDLEADLDVPVGIVGCNWGGTVSAAWMNTETVEQVGKPWMDRFKATPAYADMEAFISKQGSIVLNDRGNPFADPFYETVMPKTVGEEDMAELFAHMPEGVDFTEYAPAEAVPGCLYEHMVKTVATFAIRGFLWYQGESDDEAGLSALYQDMLGGLISDWRKLWKEDTLPFLIVQLPGYLQWLNNPAGNNYMEIRRCQQAVTDTIENTWLCSISDVGEERDIHPKDKKTVGKRLALLARGHVYGEQLLCDAPRLEKISRDKNTIEITFAHAEGGLEIRGENLSDMKLLCGGEEMGFEAAVSGEKLKLTLEKLPEGEVTVSFAEDCWICVNLYNQAGVPAIPFTAVV